MLRCLLFAIFVTLPIAQAFAALVPVRLRCEYLTNPRGIDASRPRLSWVLEARPSGERNQRQAAYRVLVASSAEKLARGAADLWDSGRVASDRQTHIEYAGAPLADGVLCHWKVQVWDSRGELSPWSERASWSMGIRDRSRWQAKWIFDTAAVVPADADERARRAAHNGFRSRASNQEDATKWVVVDLGAPKTVDTVRLWPAQFEAGGRSRFFPLRFRIEGATSADFSDAKMLADRTASDQPSPVPGTPAEYSFAPSSVRYVRLTATRLRHEDDVSRSLALAEMEVLSQGVNVARGATVTSLDTYESAGWSRKNLVDGRTGFVKGEPVLQPVSVFRQSFRVNGAVKRATAYATARGVYALRLNGRAVDDRVLAPEFTDYNQRVQYQAYDVTARIVPGENVLGAQLAAGWYAGRVGLYRRQMYGTQPAFLMRLEIELADGRTMAVVTDESWRKDPAPPLRSSDILDGEIYDARKETAGWDAPGFDGHAWKPVAADADLGGATLSAQPNEPIRPVLELKPVALTSPARGVSVFDLGQNMVGWVRLQFKGARGTLVTVRYGEALNGDGTLYTTNLRGAAETDVYTLRGGGLEYYEPRFTYHGFRYVEVSGLPSPPARTDMVGRVIYSSSPAAGKFQTSNDLLNRLMSNVLWTQRANMYSVPTDCPQRDERLGWMGDAQTFSQTAIFNMDMAGFYTKWLRDVRDDQTPDGRFPDYAPDPGVTEVPPKQVGAPAWADAGVIVPWRVWQNYGDRRLLEEHYEAARRWVDFIHAHNPQCLWETARGSDYNDWLNGDRVVHEGWPRTGGEIPKPIFATAFWAHSTDLVARMAAVLGKSDDAARYRALFDQIRAAFNRTWVKPDGRIDGDTQAGYALALHFNLLPEELRPAAVRHMVEGFARYNGHLSTGIHATNRLMLELARAGQVAEAYRLVLLRTFPSWGFMIDNGATTIWERWDGYVKGRGFQDPGMNSLNHWALGAVGEWMWRAIVGLNPDDDAPGYARFTVRPLPGGGLSSASGEYDSIRGPIRIAWSIANGRLSLRVAVPPNSSATVFVPTRDAASVTEGGRPASQASGVQFLKSEQGAAVYRVGSGSYVFSAAF
jgi:alpha-L-rhamnosidase